MRKTLTPILSPMSDDDKYDDNNQQPNYIPTN